MSKTYLIKVYHSYDKWKKYIQDFFDDVGKTLEDRKMIFWLSYKWGENFFSYTSDEPTYNAFESQFYTHFNDFQLVTDNKWIWDYDIEKSVVWELQLENKWFYPFKYSTTDSTDFILNIIRNFENFWVIKEKVWFFIELKPIRWESFIFFIKSKFQYFLLKI